MASTQDILEQVAEVLESTSKIEMETSYALLDVAEAVRQIPPDKLTPDAAASLLETLREQMAQAQFRMSLHQKFADFCRMARGPDPDTTTH